MRALEDQLDVDFGHIIVLDVCYQTDEHKNPDGNGWHWIYQWPRKNRRRGAARPRVARATRRQSARERLTPLRAFFVGRSSLQLCRRDEFATPPTASRARRGTREACALGQSCLGGAADLNNGKA